MTIAYSETRLLRHAETDENVLYVAREPARADIGMVYVRKAVFEGDIPKEIILTITPA